MAYAIQLQHKCPQAAWIDRWYLTFLSPFSYCSDLFGRRRDITTAGRLLQRECGLWVCLPVRPSELQSIPAPSDGANAPIELDCGDRTGPQVFRRPVGTSVLRPWLYHLSGGNLQMNLIKVIHCLLSHHYERPQRVTWLPLIMAWRTYVLFTSQYKYTVFCHNKLYI